MPCYKLVLAGNDHFLDQWGLFRAKKMTIWLKYVLFGLKKYLFWSYQPSCDHQGLSLAKKWLFIAKRLSREAGFGKNRPFLRPMSTSWAKKRLFKPILRGSEIWWFFNFSLEMLPKPPNPLSRLQILGPAPFVAQLAPQKKRMGLKTPIFGQFLESSKTDVVVPKSVTLIPR